MTLLNAVQSLEQIAGFGMNPYLLVADGIGHAAGARHPRLGGDPLALQLGRVGGYHSLGHQHGRQVGIGCWPDDCMTLQKWKKKGLVQHSGFLNNIQHVLQRSSIIIIIITKQVKLLYINFMSSMLKFDARRDPAHSSQMAALSRWGGVSYLLICSSAITVCIWFQSDLIISAVAN